MQNFQQDFQVALGCSFKLKYELQYHVTSRDLVPPCVLLAGSAILVSLLIGCLFCLSAETSTVVATLKLFRQQIAFMSLLLKCFFSYNFSLFSCNFNSLLCIFFALNKESKSFPCLPEPCCIPLELSAHSLNGVAQLKYSTPGEEVPC